jgi:hypothetical protein
MADDDYSEQEIAKRMERVTRRFLNMPPQPHGKNPKSPPTLKRENRPAGRSRGIHLQCDATGALTAIAAARSELDRDIPLEARERILNLLERPDEAFAVETDVGAAPARKVAVRLNPSERLLELLAALRAGNVDQPIVENA